jgi:hypothetical protein
MDILIRTLIFLVSLTSIGSCRGGLFQDNLEIMTTEIIATPSPGAQSCPETSYYEGIIVLTRYYTYLDQDLPEEAYLLLSENNRNLRSAEEFVSYSDMVFRTVEIVSIMPFPEAVRLQGGISKSDPPNQRKFKVMIRAWGEGEMSGSRMSGDLQILFITLVLEHGNWKIDQFATAP